MGAERFGPFAAASPGGGVFFMHTAFSIANLFRISYNRSVRAPVPPDRRSSAAGCKRPRAGQSPHTLHCLAQDTPSDARAFLFRGGEGERNA